MVCIGGKVRNHNKVSRNASSESFLLLQPMGSKNSDEMAKAIATYKGVKRVYLTSGRYGFVVSVNNSKSTYLVTRQLRRLTKSDTPHIVEAHFSYKS